MSEDLEGHLHERFMQALAPLMIAPIGRQPAEVRLAGIVRAGVNESRLMLVTGDSAPARVAVAFRLTRDERELDIHAAFDWIRTLTRADLADVAGERDSHGYVIIAAEELGFSAAHGATRYDSDYFTLLRMMLYGGSVWFREVFSLAGYLLIGSQRHRLYIRNSTTNVVTGIELPLTDTDGSVYPGMGGTFPTILTSLVENDELNFEIEVPEHDDYCSKVYDLSAWVSRPNPTGPDQPDEVVPEDFSDLVILSPDQYTAMMKASEEKRQDAGQNQPESGNP